MTITIESNNLTKIYGPAKNTPAIENLDLAVEQGQLFGLIGPDGAGKTTTLRILATVMKASEGEVRIGGFDIGRRADRARAIIGYMPQQFSLYPDLSVMENLRFFADLNGVSPKQRRERIPRLLDFTHLAAFPDRRSASLSGGMRKKLALACALIHDPQVLLLDEPTTGVDPVSRRELWGILADIVQQGVTVLMSTPYMDEAERCHQIAMLHQGKVLTQGIPGELQGKVPFDVIEVKARPRKRMRQIVDGLEGIQDWRPVGDRLRVSVPAENGSAARILKQLRAIFKKEALDLHILKETKTSMEDVFVYLYRAQGEAV
jgi:ABC-2 type transport system ATP-binding protein